MLKQLWELIRMEFCYYSFYSVIHAKQTMISPNPAMCDHLTQSVFEVKVDEMTHLSFITHLMLMRCETMTYLM